MSWKDDITEKIGRRIPALVDRENEDLCLDLVEDAFRSIMTYSKATIYNKEWDNVLVRCVCMLYNNIGMEGSISRESLSTTDTFDSTDIIGSFIQKNIPQYVRPIGYSFEPSRFDLPED